MPPHEEKRLRQVRKRAEGILRNIIAEHGSCSVSGAMQQVYWEAENRRMAPRDVSYAISRCGGPLAWLQQLPWVRKSWNDQSHEYMMSLASSSAVLGEETEEVKEINEVQDATAREEGPAPAPPDRGAGQLNPRAKDFCSSVPWGDRDDDDDNDDLYKSSSPLGSDGGGGGGESSGGVVSGSGSGSGSGGGVAKADAAKARAEAAPEVETAAQAEAAVQEAVTQEAAMVAEQTLAEREGAGEEATAASSAAGGPPRAEDGPAEDGPAELLPARKELQPLDSLPLQASRDCAADDNTAAVLRAEAVGHIILPSPDQQAAPTPAATTTATATATATAARFERSTIRQHGQAVMMTQWELERRMDEAAHTTAPEPPPAAATSTAAEAAAAPPPPPPPPPAVKNTRYARLLCSQEPAPSEVMKLTLRRATAEQRWGVRLAGMARPRVVLLDHAALGWQQGVRVGDVLLTINGQSCTAGHAATTNMLRGGGLNLKVEISRRQHPLAAETVQRYQRGVSARRALARQAAANDADAEAVRAAQERAFAAAAEAAQARSARSAVEQTLAEAMAEAEAAAKAAEAAVAAADLVEEEMLCCPITTQEMVDPVLTMDGQTYERTAILAWLAKSATSPMTGEPLESTRLIPNVAIKMQCTLRRAEREAGRAAQATAAAAAATAASAGRGGAGRGGRGGGRGGRGAPKFDSGDGPHAAQVTQHV